MTANIPARMTAEYCPVRSIAPLLVNRLAPASEYELRFSVIAVKQGTPVMRKPDRYETRARELALAAGVDPDSRIERPGQRSMPAWCAYRDAARKEHVASEVAAVELPPQAPEFQNAPLKVFGNHDENTIAQMRDCMGVGNVVAGVICADGHLGYAQPVGGVIAYEGQISISGVGFDIGCGNMAARLDTPFAGIKGRVGIIIKGVSEVISFGIG